MSLTGRLFLPGVFALTGLLASALLFWIQPLIAKLLLPRLGGTPAVWNTCLLFFQGAVLAGYAWVLLLHLKGQLWWRILILGPVVVLLALSAWLGLGLTSSAFQEAPDQPVWSTLVLLSLSVGMAVLVLAGVTPYLQRSFAATGHPAARDPYFLGAAANLGGLAALVLFPLALEPNWGLFGQYSVWKWAWAPLAIMLGACSVLAWSARARALTVPEEPDKPAAAPEALARPTTLTRLRWLACSAAPVSLLMGLTTHFTVDIAPTPYLWMGPLALYFFTWVLAFARLTWWRSLPFVGRLVIQVVLGVAVFFLLVFALIMAALLDVPVMAPYALGVFVLAIAAAPWRWMLVLQPLAAVAAIFDLGSHTVFGLGSVLAHFLAFACTARLCHGLVARSRPASAWLPEYYCWIAAGGLLGGLFNAVAAPRLFTHGLLEYPLVLALACGLRPPYLRNGLVDWVLCLLVEEGRGRKSMGTNVVHVALAWSFDVLIGVGICLPIWGIFAGQDDLLRLFNLRQADFGRSRLLYQLLIMGPALLLCLIVIARPLRFTIGLTAAVAFFSAYEHRPGAVHLLTAQRNSFGTLRVYADQEGVDLGLGGFQPDFRYLMHGTTYHGRNYLDGGLRRLATTYYHVRGPVGASLARYAYFQNAFGQPYPGDVRVPASLIGQAAGLAQGDVPWGPLLTAQSEPPIAVLGLGVGTMASYARPFQRMDFYELDPDIIRLSERSAGKQPYFFFIEEARERGAQINVIAGDARLTLAKHGPKGFYQRIYVDAFSSDAIPVHLLTKEALELYLDKLAPDGVLCLHTSNRWLDLPPVIARNARALGLAMILGQDHAAGANREPDRGRFASQWLFLARQAQHLPNRGLPNRAKLLRFGGPEQEIGWEIPQRMEGPPWTDDYSSLVTALRPEAALLFNLLKALLIGLLILGIGFLAVETLFSLIRTLVPRAETEDSAGLARRATSEAPDGDLVLEEWTDPTVPPPLPPEDSDRGRFRPGRSRPD